MQMSFFRPFEFPIPEKTTKRCQYALPGMYYGCRRVGKYVLEENRYCASHYEARWLILHPVIGTAHDWHYHVNSLTLTLDAFLSCRRCGVVKNREGVYQSPCRGVLPRIELR